MTIRLVRVTVGVLIIGWLIFAEGAQQNDAAAADSYTLAGLERPVEILVDPWGIAHIYAATLDDLFFAQGFNAARDRLWQIDLWRRRGLGLLSEVFGPAWVDKDRAARLLLYRGPMEAEWNAYGPDSRRITMAFARGVNAYIEAIRRKPALLPVEFTLLGYEAAMWSPEDIVRIRTHGLWRNLRNEVRRAESICRSGLELEQVRSVLEPPWQVKVPEGVDPCAVSSEILKVYDLGTGGMELQDGAVAAPSPSADGDPWEGSNNWAVAPARTATGRPIVANDPHRVIGVPSLRYGVHLSGAGIDVIGAGEPFLPGVSVGHNGKVGFGLTITAIDQEDLYIYQTDPEHPARYRYRDGWESMVTVVDEIPVKAKNPVRVELKFTRHGPVLYEDAARHTVFAARLAWLGAGMAPYFGSISSMRAVDGRQFLAALRRWGGPSLNHVFADTSGHIGWKPWGRTPVRPNWDGLVPVSGDGRYEWDGFYTVDKLPEEFDPQRGWVASANQMNLPEDYPYRERKIGFEWTAPWRYLRIAEVLTATTRMTVGGSLQLQTDYLSMPARRIVALLQGVSSSDAEVTRAIELLRSWDFVLAADSTPAVIFEVWMRRHLAEAVRRKLMGPEAGSGAPMDARGLLQVLENPDVRLGPDPALERRQLLLSSLRAAIDDLKKQLGPAVQKWSWGQLHHTFLEHPLAAGSGDARRALIPPGRRMPRGGSEDTVGATSYRTSDYRQTGGASWRMILDVGDWDRSVAMNTPGQSGDPSSPHYSDLLARWARDQAFPLLYSRKLIEAVAERRILLSPVASRRSPVARKYSGQSAAGSRQAWSGRDRAR